MTTLQQDLLAMTSSYENMKKMWDDNAVCYQQALAKLKEVDEKIIQVLKMFLLTPDFGKLMDPSADFQELVLNEDTKASI